MPSPVWLFDHLDGALRRRPGREPGGMPAVAPSHYQNKLVWIGYQGHQIVIALLLPFLRPGTRAPVTPVLQHAQGHADVLEKVLLYGFLRLEPVSSNLTGELRAKYHYRGGPTQLIVVTRYTRCLHCAHYSL